ncbi:histidine phosphatase family protein [Micrococcus lylae]|uniref:histidine phosphatase family protein n=1 Tax=Micrococcus lylae TaxID=1273 RepID=UPI000B3504DF|nr:histidine phosphatase family protein [Micrococcus lylae]
MAVQAAQAGDRIAAVPVAAGVPCPLRRCAQTAGALVERQPATVLSTVEADLTECDYGNGQGRALSDLATEPLWATAQTQPSAICERPALWTQPNRTLDRAVMKIVKAGGGVQAMSRKERSSAKADGTTE